MLQAHLEAPADERRDLGVLVGRRRRELLAQSHLEPAPSYLRYVSSLRFGLGRVPTCTRFGSKGRLSRTLSISRTHSSSLDTSLTHSQTPKSQSQNVVGRCPRAAARGASRSDSTCATQSASHESSTSSRRVRARRRRHKRRARARDLPFAHFERGGGFFLCVLPEPSGHDLEPARVPVAARHRLAVPHQLAALQHAPHRQSLHLGACAAPRGGNETRRKKRRCASSLTGGKRTALRRRRPPFIQTRPLALSSCERMV